MGFGRVYLSAGHPAHNKVLVLQTVVVFLLVAGSFSSVEPLETSERSSAGLRVEGVHDDRLCTFDLTAAEWAALTLGLLVHTQEAG